MSRIVNMRIYTFAELPTDIQEKAIRDYITAEGCCPEPYEVWRVKVIDLLRNYEFFETGDIYGEKE